MTIALNHTRFDAAVYARIARQVCRRGDCVIWQGGTKNDAPIVRYSGKTLSVRLYVFRLAKGWAPVRLGACPEDPRCVHPGHTGGRGVIANDLAAMDAGVFLRMLEPFGTTGEPAKPKSPATPAVEWVGGLAVVVEAPADKTVGTLRERLAARCLPTWQAAGLREATMASLTGTAADISLMRSAAG